MTGRSDSLLGRLPPGARVTINAMLQHLLTRRFTFSACHRLSCDRLDAEDNALTYGPCTTMHGHNYRLEVTVTGPVDPQIGFACNVIALERLVHSLIIAPCDHNCLNDVPLLAGIPPTMENIASRIWTALEDELPALGVELVEILVAETDDNVVRLRRRPHHGDT